MLASFFINSRYLFADVKSLYDLQIYLSEKLLDNKRKLDESNSALEDITTTTATVERMRQHFAGKLLNAETKNLHLDTVFLKQTK